jgi:FKBP-type peptidyl-prolyl cis-trans isomerase FkpA
MMLKIAILSLAALSGAALAQEAAPPAPAERDADFHNRQLMHLYALDTTGQWSRTASGLRYRRVKGDGSGRHPAQSDTVTIHYAGRFIDGSEFDSSIARGEPATFPLPRLIKGWQEGVPLMGIGDTFEFAIPWQLAYGSAGKGPIPGGATLLFTIELIAIPE